MWREEGGELRLAKVREDGQRVLRLGCSRCGRQVSHVYMSPAPKQTVAQ